MSNQGNSGAISGAKSGATNQSFGATNQVSMGMTSQVSSSISGAKSGATNQSLGATNQVSNQGNSGAISGAKSGATNQSLGAMNQVSMGTMSPLGITKVTTSGARLRTANQLSQTTTKQAFKKLGRELTPKTLALSPIYQSSKSIKKSSGQRTRSHPSPKKSYTEKLPGAPELAFDVNKSTCYSMLCPPTNCISFNNIPMTTMTLATLTSLLTMAMNTAPSSACLDSALVSIPPTRMTLSPSASILATAMTTAHSDVIPVTKMTKASIEHPIFRNRHKVKASINDFTYRATIIRCRVNNSNYEFQVFFDGKRLKLKRWLRINEIKLEQENDNVINYRKIAIDWQDYKWLKIRFMNELKSSIQTSPEDIQYGLRKSSRLYSPPNSRENSSDSEACPPNELKSSLTTRFHKKSSDSETGPPDSRKDTCSDYKNESISSRSAMKSTSVVKMKKSRLVSRYTVHVAIKQSRWGILMKK